MSDLDKVINTFLEKMWGGRGRQESIRYEVMFNQLENTGMLDRMYTDWCAYKDTSVWHNKYELWKKWLRI